MGPVQHMHKAKRVKAQSHSMGASHAYRDQGKTPNPEVILLRSMGRALRVGLGADEQQLAVRDVQQRCVGRRDPGIPACIFV